MPQKGLVGSRAVVERNYAILPPEGIPESVLPEWSGTAARVLAAPAMGARFAMYQLDLAAGGGSEHAAPEGVEAFFFVASGECRLDLGGKAHALKTGGFAYLRPGARFKLAAAGPSRVFWLKKLYEPLDARRRASAGDPRSPRSRLRRTSNDRSLDASEGTGGESGGGGAQLRHPAA